jgi:uncharacterized protein (DUF1800 family)
LLKRAGFELFTLDEGHYSEHDIKEVARIITGGAVALLALAI